MFLGVSLHPEVLRKAHAELDAIVGPHRLPNFGDRDSLVYVNAIIKESLRWHTVLPVGLPHANVSDDEFRGYFIPTGTVLIANVWYVALRSHCRLLEMLNFSPSRACMSDPEIYEDPEVFRPERFIRGGKLDTSVRDPAAFVFGFGRRHVPPMHAYLPVYATLTPWLLESVPGGTLPRMLCSSVSPVHCMSSTSGRLSGTMGIP